VLVGVAEQLGVALERARLRGLDDEARRRADLLQRLAASLSRAALPVEVAEASIPYLLEAFDAALATVGLAAGDDVRTLKVPRDLDRNAWAWRPVPRSTSTPTADAMRERRAIELHGRERIHDAYPPEVEQLLAGVASMLVVPFSRAAGAAGVAFEDDRVLSRDERRLLDAIADELTRSLERAALLEGERDARLQAELMERHAARLAAATSAAEVAAATVAELEAFGADVVLVWSVSESPDLDVLGSSMRPELAELGAHPLGRAGLVADVMRERKLITFDTAEEYDARYPRLAGVRATLGAESLAALPLRTARGEIVGAILAVSRRRRWIAPERRPLLLGIAEQTGVALERARLQGEVERVAEDSTFLALLGESLERATTVHGRARRVVEELADGRATFAAIHLLGEEGEVDEVARAGSLPAELADVRRWREWIERVAATGREPSAEVSAGDGASAPGSLLVLPLQARGRSLGVLTLRLAAGVDRKPVITPAVAREVAARAALALDNAVLYERERGVSHALQLGLLGGALPDFEKVVVTPAYRAGTAALEVGGDWYDAFSLLSGSSAFVVGDVVGHGLEAAVAMGQLRGAVSALAQTSAPAELLDQLDAFVENVPSAATATLAFVDLDPESGDFRYACAGHPPPLVISPDGRTRYLWEGRSAPLGSMLGDRRGDAEGQLAEGETLVLYTDGLVERRSESIDAGLERLADAARLGALGAPALADEICDRLLDAQVQDDDVCVLTIHRMPEEAMFSRSFRASPSELADLRERLRRWLEEQGVAEDVERGIVLAVSEAAANAVEHGYGCDGVGLVTVMARAADDRLEVTVRDEGAWREPRRDTDRGRGIEIMRAIMDEVRVDRDGPATVIRMSQRAQQTAST
jgi:serine/threonine-protein kinase RsbW